MAKKSGTTRRGGAGKGAGTPATVALGAAGIEFTEHVYVHDPRASSFGLEAAQALGLAPEQVYKTLLAQTDDELVVGVVPVTGQLDLKALARAVGAARCVMAEPAAAQRATGYVLGGISPVGQKKQHRTALDQSALEHARIYVSGGRRGFDIGLDPADLVRMTAAITAPIARRPGR